MLWALRMVLVLLMLVVVVYAVTQEMDSWCRDEYSHSKGPWDRVVSNWHDDSYTVPEAQREPALSMKEFYAVEDRGLLDWMMKTRLTFQAQNHMGTVLRDGFHVDLPVDTMWRGGVLVRGEAVRQQMLLAQRPPQHQPPSSSPH